KSSEIVLKNLDSFSLRMLESFSNGVNFYIERFSKRLPVEFQALNYKPNPWTPLDCILIGRLMAFTMSFSFWLDLTFFDIASKIGYEKAFLLLPNKFENYDAFLNDTVRIKLIQFDSSATKQIFGYKLDQSVLETVERFYPFICGQNGSNTWAVQSKTNSGTKAILASDPHLKLSLPPFWYQMHITTSKFNIVGLCLPGVPLPLIGRNDYISWGITNGMLDDCDFFVHSLDSTGKFVVDSVRTLRINYKLDTIKVRNSSDFIYYQRFIGEDLILSDFLLLKDSTSARKFYDISDSPQLPQNLAFTFKWTGQFFSNEFKALYQISNSKNWNDFLTSKKFWGSPALNFSYADVKGNIGLMLAGYVPVRNNVHPNFPSFVISRNSSWIGVERLDNEFNIYNPKDGMIFNANNKT
ncbi:MAG: penicillin acylase family protein, partial [Candidatus Kapaibacteriota bacterium]